MEQDKIYKTVVRIEILHDTPHIMWDDLNDIAYNISSGPWSGQIDTEGETVELVGQEAHDAIFSQGSDPSFFFGE
jgi:hypothetical protein